MPLRTVFFTLTLFVAPHSAEANPNRGLRWVYETVGAQAPHVERFEIWPGSVRWLDAQGRTQWHLSRSSGMLTMVDHDALTFRRLNEVGIGALRSELRAALTAQRMRVDPAPGQEKSATTRRELGAELLKNRPWAALEAANAWATLGTKDTVVGTVCQRFVMKTDTTPVGETCLADAQAIPGGSAVLQMLLTLGKISDHLRAGLVDAESIAWPLHPLVAAARTGGVPLRVLERVDGEVRNELRLTLMQPMDLEKLEVEGTGIPPEYRPVSVSR